MRLLQNGRRAARLQRQERRVLPQVMLPSQSIYVWLQAERPSLAQPGNPVLSLSKHAWSPRPPFDRLLYGRRPRCKRNLALMRSGVQVMYSACCCGIEDRWP